VRTRNSANRARTAFEVALRIVRAALVDSLWRCPAYRSLDLARPLTRWLPWSMAFNPGSATMLHAAQCVKSGLQC